MRTYTQYRNDIANYCNVKNTDTKAMAKIDGFLNDSIRTICNLHGGQLRFLETTEDLTTTADKETYELPNKFRKLMDVFLYNGAGSPTDTIYTPRVIYDPKLWKKVLQSRYGTSEVPYFVYVENKTFKIQPIPSTTGNKITLRGRVTTKDLSIADYTTGTITDIANDDTTVTGSGTTWTSAMAGRYIKFDEASGGDGFWYEIASVTSATELELVKNYQGVTVSGGLVTYTIGQASVIPEAYDVGVVYRSTALWWDNQNDLTRGKTYWLKYDGGREAGYSKDYGGLMKDMIINEGETEEGAYIPPLNNVDVYDNNYYNPWQQASGF